MLEAVSQCIVFGGGTQLTVLGESPPCPPLWDLGYNLGVCFAPFNLDRAEAQGLWVCTFRPLCLRLVPPLVSSCPMSVQSCRGPDPKP